MEAWPSEAGGDGGVGGAEGAAAVLLGLIWASPFLLAQPQPRWRWNLGGDPQWLLTTGRKSRCGKGRVSKVHLFLAGIELITVPLLSAVCSWLTGKGLRGMSWATDPVARAQVLEDFLADTHVHENNLTGTDLQSLGLELASIAPATEATYKGAYEEWYVMCQMLPSSSVCGVRVWHCPLHHFLFLPQSASPYLPA